MTTLNVLLCFAIATLLLVTQYLKVQLRKEKLIALEINKLSLKSSISQAEYDSVTT